MRIDRFANLAIRLSRVYKNYSLQEIYDEIMKDEIMEPVRNLLNGNELVDICFFIYNIKNVKNPSEYGQIYQKIKGNMFSFSTCTLGDYSEVTCMNCNGDAYENCRTCDGSGEVWDDVMDFYEDCPDCSEGLISCEDCDGNGEITDESNYQADQNFYISIDPSLYNLLETKEELDEVSEDLIHNFDTNKTILIRKDFNAKIENQSFMETGNTYFLGLSKENNFEYKKSIKSIDDLSIVNF